MNKYYSLHISFRFYLIFIGVCETPLQMIGPVLLLHRWFRQDTATGMEYPFFIYISSINLFIPSTNWNTIIENIHGIRILIFLKKLKIYVIEQRFCKTFINNVTAKIITIFFQILSAFRIKLSRFSFLSSK